MLKMERGAARSASRNSSVVDMEELKRARERRASSARHPSEKIQDDRQKLKEQIIERAAFTEDDKPFWDQESPFVEEEKPFWQQDRPFRSTDDYQGNRQQTSQQLKSARRKAEQDDGYQSKPSTSKKAAQDDWQPVRKPDRRQPARDDRFQTRQNDRQSSARANTKSGRAGLKVLLVLLGLLALFVVIGLKIFEIRDIEVKGAETVSKESIIALSGINMGDNIFKVSLGQAKQNLQSDPLVEVLGISRAFPDKIIVEIRQRQPHGAIAYLGSYVIIDEKGFVVDVRDSLPVGQYPLVTGIDIEPSVKGKPLVGIQGGAKDLLYQVLSALYDNKALPFVSEVNLADTNKIMMLTSEGLQIDIGRPSDLGKKAQWIACSVPELRSKGYTSGILYVTGANSPIFSATNTDSASQGDAANNSDGGNTGKTDVNSDSSKDDTAAGDNSENMQGDAVVTDDGSNVQDDTTVTDQGGDGQDNTANTDGSNEDTGPDNAA